MVRRREPRQATSKRQPTDEQIEDFAAQAEENGPSAPAPTAQAVLDPHAARDFKAIRVPFNEYEYSTLEKVANQTGRTKLNAIRWAILKLAETEEVLK